MATFKRVRRRVISAAAPLGKAAGFCVSREAPLAGLSTKCFEEPDSSCKYLVEIPTAGPSADTLKLTALPSRAASCDRFAARLRLGQPDAFGAGASRD